MRGALKNKDGEPKAGEKNKGANEEKKPGAGAKSDQKDGNKDAAAENGANKAVPQDYQLARALDLLRGVAMFRSRMVN